MMEVGSATRGLLILCNLLAFTSTVTGSYQLLTYRNGVSIREYTSFNDATFFVGSVPQFAEQATWQFAAYTSSAECEDRTIYIYARHGSFPLLRPNNESFPENFNLHQTDSWSSTFSTENSTFYYEDLEPLPGNWYIAYFINDYLDEKIKQKGLGGHSCQYFVETELHVNWLEEVDVIEPGKDITVTMDSTRNRTFRVLLSELTWQLELSVHTCEVSTEDNGTWTGQDCPLMVSIRGEGLPQLFDPITDSTIKNCSGEDPCALTVSSISTNEWNYIRFKSLVPGNVTFTMRLSTRDCQRHEFFSSRESEVFEPRISVNANSTNSSSLRSNESAIITRDSFFDDSRVTTHSPVSPYSSNGTDDSLSIMTSSNSSEPDSSPNICVWLPEMARVSYSTQAFNSDFRITSLNWLVLPKDKDLILKFTLKHGVDVGGTLKFRIYFVKTKNSVIIDGTVGIVEACVQRRRIPTNESTCNPGHKLILTSENITDARVFFPYPEPGPWYVSLRGKCYTNSSKEGGREERNCSDVLVVGVSATIGRCVNDKCGKYGQCFTYYNGDVHFSSCKCHSKWRGYGCTDGTVGETDSEQLTAVLLLTLSNFAFVPCIAVSLYRKFFLEALVYFFTMFFSTFYHACDGDRAYTYCMIPYNTLAVCDFFGSLMSFWVTLVAMSRLTEPIRSFLYMLAALGLSLGVTWDRHSLWTFLVPVLVAFIIMVITWVIQMVQSRSCYPSKKSWLFRLLPGILMALLGLIIYAFLETQSNYQYTHSAWHACMAFSVVFLLPPKRLNRDGLLPVSDYSTFERTAILQWVQNQHSNNSSSSNSNNTAAIVPE